MLEQYLYGLGRRLSAWRNGHVLRHPDGNYLLLLRLRAQTIVQERKYVNRACAPVCGLRHRTNKLNLSFLGKDSSVR